MIALEHLSLVLGEFSLHDVDLHISRGEYLVIMGPSGAGKTVLLETIAGLRFPDSGRILLGGIDAGSIPSEKRRIAIVYQDYSLFPHMTAYENIAYGLRLRRVSRPETEQQVRSLLGEFNITHLADHYPSSMSGGEQQRVALARALAMKPEILLLDEPFAALDPRTREECMRMMLAVKKSQGLTIIQVSHSREEAYGVSDRVALIIDGCVVQTGSADDLFRNPQSPAAAHYAGIDNIFSGTVLSCDGTFSVLDIGGHQITLEGNAPVGSSVTIGIAGEQVSLVEETRVVVDTALNAVCGTVTDILPMEHSVKIRIGGVLPMTAVVKRNNGLTPFPSPGDQRVALFRPGDVHLLEGEE
ncbi:MAG: ATP-binding cassette domain-containing protein [Methanoregula sp.]|nr:ATP-binding cassette domain-containing protein [Methanoregula sp.]